MQAMESAPKPAELNNLRKGTVRFSFTVEAKGKECYACGQGLREEGSGGTSYSGPGLGGTELKGPGRGQVSALSFGIAS